MQINWSSYWILGLFQFFLAILNCAIILSLFLNPETFLIVLAITSPQGSRFPVFSTPIYLHAAWGLSQGLLSVSKVQSPEGGNPGALQASLPASSATLHRFWTLSSKYSFSPSPPSTCSACPHFCLWKSSSILREPPGMIDSLQCDDGSDFYHV